MTAPGNQTRRDLGWRHETQHSMLSLVMLALLVAVVAVGSVSAPFLDRAYDEMIAVDLEFDESEPSDEDRDEDDDDGRFDHGPGDFVAPLVRHRDASCHVALSSDFLTGVFRPPAA